MNIVLVEPEIHWNTGNIGRTCLAIGAQLHLVAPLGFDLDEKAVRRAGLDYWPKVAPVVHRDLKAFFAALPARAKLKLFSTEGKMLYWDAAYSSRDWLIFGKESVGLPKELRQRYADRLYRIPVSQDVRSLNLSTAVGIVAYEAARQLSPRPVGEVAAGG